MKAKTIASNGPMKNSLIPAEVKEDKLVIKIDGVEKEYDIPPKYQPIVISEPQGFSLPFWKAEESVYALYLVHTTNGQVLTIDWEKFEVTAPKYDPDIIKKHKEAGTLRTLVALTFSNIEGSIGIVTILLIIVLIAICIVGAKSFGMI